MDGRSQALLYSLASGVDIRKKDQKDLRIKLVESGPKQDDHKRETLKHRNKQTGSESTNHKSQTMTFGTRSSKHLFVFWDDRRNRKTLNSLEVLACEQALWGALAAGREKEEEHVTTSLEFELHLRFSYGSPSTELSDLSQSARSGNERECVRRHYLCHLCQSAFCVDFFDADQYSNPRDVVASPPFPASPPERPGELAR